MLLLLEEEEEEEEEEEHSSSSSRKRVKEEEEEEDLTSSTTTTTRDEETPPNLPPSSSDIVGIPEDAVPLLFSVYSFLRTFSRLLFLTPFSLNDFVGALNCPTHNSLLDSVHVSLLRPLLTQHNPTLLDSFTWPVFLLRYLYLSHTSFEFLLPTLSHAEYYTLPAASRLLLLQILADHLLQSAPFRSELALRNHMIMDDDDDQTMDLDAHLSLSDHSDGNSNECQLCGMDGTLICCDGCPAAYHSRCIGLSKASLPGGLWLCPECTVQKKDPASSQISFGIRGAEVLGVDPFGQAFLRTCNYLLVVGSSYDAKSSSKYYNQGDIVKILQVLSFCRKTSAYADLYQSISMYWGIESADIFISERSTPVSFEKSAPTVNSLRPSLEPFHNLGCDEGDSCTSDRTKTSTNDKSSIKLECTSTCTGSFEKMIAHGDEQPTPLKGDQTGNVIIKNNSFIHTKSQEQSGDEPVTLHKRKRLTLASGSGCTMHGSCNDKSLCTGKFLYTGRHFKHNAYLNQYIHGELAASAAANYASLTEENRVPDTHANSNPRKVMAAKFALQMKAFSGVAMHFIWPTEKKAVDTPRDRCGWCLACRAATNYKRGCFLNAAVTSAVKFSNRTFGSSHLVKKESCRYSSIATYILHMEENLHGLIDGCLLDANYNMMWHKFVKEASTCAELKPLLLELERNIRGIAFSAGWHKVEDGLSVEFSCAENGPSLAGASQKHELRGRRGRKRPVVPDVTPDDCDESPKEMQWWYGGRLRKAIFLKGSLPRSVARKAARQGGSTEVRGLCYATDSETASRSRQTAWRAAVEMSKKTCQLALQVRYLDSHLRWKDFVCPDQFFSEGKTTDSEASAFRNAVILNKKAVESRIRYGLVFNNRKHIPMRVKKSILDIERGQDEKEIFWFSENNVPLYLIKEYEKKQAVHAASFENISNRIAPKRQIKAMNKDTFLYLFERGEKPDSFCCPSCNEDVLLRDAVRCRTCQGYCHKHCLLPLNHGMKGDLDFLFRCDPCYRAESCTDSENHFQGYLTGKNHMELGAMTGESFVCSSLLQPTYCQMDRKIKPHDIDSNPEQKRSKRNIGYGLIWKRKKNELATDFLVENLILKGCASGATKRPECRLCSTMYNPDLLYIRCPYCMSWYHADAVQLYEERVTDLMGFKCCKCRRMRSPICPYRKETDQKAALKPSRQTVTTANCRSVVKLECSEVQTSTMDHSKMTESVVGRIQEGQLSWGAASAPSSQNLMNVDFDTNHGTYGSCEMEKVGEEACSMEYEPQTYFSLTELLAAGDEGGAGLFDDMSVDVSGNLEMTLGDVHDELRGCIDAPVCQKCNSHQILPDLICEICGFIVHSHCSPWEELGNTGADGVWRCGHCREWQ